MIALISGIIGFVLPFLGEVLKYFRAKDDRKHELAVMEMQIRAQQAAGQQRLDEIRTEATASYDIEALKATRVEKTGVRWVDATLALATGMVRPTVTYSYFGLYAAVKVSIIVQAQRIEQDLARVLAGSWTQADEAQFGLVMGFWFGNRTVKYMKGGA